MKRHIHLAIILSALTLFGSAQKSQATAFADQVVSYIAGSGVGAYTDPTAALGAPSSDTGFGVFSPFNPPFATNQLARIGAGGQLTLRLSNYAVIGAGPEIGIFENVGLIDSTGNGTTDATASVFGDDTANVEVSEDGMSWFNLGVQNFTLPANFYDDAANTGPYASAAAAGAALADFGKPFTGTLADFNSKSTYANVLSVFNGSAGGTWLDLDSTGLTRVGYVRFSLSGTATNTLEIDAVSVSNQRTGTAVPEMPAASLLGLGGLMFALPNKRWRKSACSLAILCVAASPHARAATSHMLINFDNGAAFRFDITFTGTKNGEDLLLLTSNAGIGFQAQFQSFSFGDFLTGISYLTNTDSGDGSAPPDFENYWHYWTSPAGASPVWTVSSVGAGSRTESDGTWDAWVFGSDTAPQTATGAPITVPEPQTIVIFAIGTTLLLLQRRRKS